jgi:hypothetical protein
LLYDVTTLAGWRNAIEALQARLQTLGNYAKLLEIEEALQALLQNRSTYATRDVCLYDDHGGIWIILISLAKMSTGERLQDALTAVESPVIEEIKVTPKGKAQACEVRIQLKPRPAESAVIQ